MTYKEAREFIDNSNQYGSKLGLEAITELLRRLGNPQDRLKVIHVAGTNGKGSTSAFIATILTSGGYRVGRYISPAVFSYRERIQISSAKRDSNIFSLDVNIVNTDVNIVTTAVNKINIDMNMKNKDVNMINTNVNIINTDDNMHKNSVDSVHTEYITELGVSDAIDIIKPICEAMAAEGLTHPTSFEIETAMAFLYLSWKQVDFAVIEVGMGGRLDATNVIDHPICSVITSISMDHMQFLGDTLELITREKAGIIKKGAPLITSNKNPRVLEVLEKVCYDLETSVSIADIELAMNLNFSLEGTKFCYKEQEYEIKLLGEYQLMNAVLAIETVDKLRELGYPISEDNIRNGLLWTKWSGRFEMIAKKPYFIIDGAHNEDAALQLKKTLLTYYPGRKLIFILGVLADKDYPKILEITAKYAKVIITITPNNNRALASSELAKEVAKYSNGKVIDAVTVERAVKYAYKNTESKEDIILAFGSLSYLGEICELVKVQIDYAHVM